MENRIKINGVWYVKEGKEGQTEVAKIVDITDFDPMYFKEMQIDLEDRSFVAMILTNDDFKEKDHIHSASIDVKTIDHKTTIECMDNESFLRGVANRSPQSLDELVDSTYSKLQTEAIVALCDEMKKHGWI